MNTRTVGVITIGQTPRPDVVKQLRLILGDEPTILVAGALDEATETEISSMTPNRSEDSLFTFLRSGEQVIVGKAEIAVLVRRCMDRFAQQGVDVILISCTAAFRNLTPKGNLVLPYLVLPSLVHAILPAGRLGIFTPLASQEDQVRAKWSSFGWELSVQALLPREMTPELESSARHMAATSPHLIVMDCMGYSQAMKERVRAATGIPTILAITTAARAVQELID